MHGKVVTCFFFFVLKQECDSTHGKVFFFVFFSKNDPLMQIALGPFRSDLEAKLTKSRQSLSHLTPT